MPRVAKQASLFQWTNRTGGLVFMTASHVMPKDRPRCVYCDRDSDQVPLIALRYQAAEAWICPQHLPMLIHAPAKLAGKLAGAERLAPADHHHD
jgi:hypothetical protein